VKVGSVDVRMKGVVGVGSNKFERRVRLPTGFSVEGFVRRLRAEWLYGVDETREQEVESGCQRRSIFV
jgi:hypothetical protein